MKYYSRKLSKNARKRFNRICVGKESFPKTETEDYEEGSFSSVSIFDRKRVIKHFENSYGYREFVESVLRSNSKYIPKVYAYCWDEEETEGYVLMEKLEHNYEMAGYIIRQYYQSKSSDDCRIKKAANAIRKLEKYYGLEFDDLHTGNIMFRKDGSAVLTDPMT